MVESPERLAMTVEEKFFHEAFAKALGHADTPLEVVLAEVILHALSMVEVLPETQAKALRLASARAEQLLQELN